MGSDGGKLILDHLHDTLECRCLPDVQGACIHVVWCQMITQHTHTHAHTQELYIQMDGASDNANFTNIHFFCWFLLLMRYLGYPLCCIHLCRLIVGHTHNDVDMRHSLSSQARSAEEPNLWSFTSFKKWLQRVHQNELKGFFDINRVYDFKTFVAEMHHDADEKVNTWMHVQLELRDNNTVWARSKPRMGRRVEWDDARRGLQDSMAVAKQRSDALLAVLKNENTLK